MGKLKKILCILLVSAFLLSSVSVVGSAADAFETSLKVFPESYRGALRQLHEKYPKWVFQALNTGLDWQTAVRNESSGNVSLITASRNFSDLFKSKASDNYNAKTDTYSIKDPGFTRASEIAVAYFMDPRNMLNDYNIFQFENNRFSRECTVEDVDAVLKGSDFYQTSMHYYKKDGTLVKNKMTYAQAIFEAGQTYDINPCFLASKIRNEVGNSTGNSVNGKVSGYEGLYNFYNIGASDGGDPVRKGLNWASSTSGTYGRPWTSPYKSIMGGAEFLAEQYIDIGQFTPYLQKFQVNPACKYSLYTHQYMTNVACASEQAYMVYDGYYSKGTLADKRIFTIPVYQNMDDIQSVSYPNLAESVGQTAKLTADVTVYSQAWKQSDCAVLSLTKGTQVEVLQKEKTKATYYWSVLLNPFWCKISFSYRGKNYSGYVSANDVEYMSYSVFPKGEFELPSVRSNTNMHLVSLDSSMTSVRGNRVTFLKEGTAELYAYTSCGGFDIIRVYVKNSSAKNRKITDPSVSATDTSFSVSWQAPQTSLELSYLSVLLDENTGVLSMAVDTKTSCAFMNQKPAKKLFVFVRAFNTSNSIRYFSYVKAFTPVMLLPQTPSTCKAKQGENGIVFTWTASQGAQGYNIYKNVSGKYQLVSSTQNTTLTLVDISLSDAALFRVRSYYLYDSQYIFSRYSPEFTTDYTPPRVKQIKQENTTASSYTLKWEPSIGADGYRLEMKNADGSFQTMQEVKTCRLVVNGQPAGKKACYRVTSYCIHDDVYHYASPSAELETSTLSQVPAKLRVVRQTADKVDLKWNKAGEDVTYQVVYQASDGSYEQVAMTTALTCTLPSFQGVRCFYVRSLIKISGQSVYSAFSNALKVGFSLKKPGGFSCSGYKGGFRLTWKAVDGADGYQIYRYNPFTKSYVYLTKLTEPAYYVFGAAKGEKIYYRVRAYSSTVSGIIYSNFGTSGACTAK